MEELPSTLAPPAPEYHTLDGADLERFLQRQKAAPTLPGDIDLAQQLRQILEKARELVPSQSGAILLDDPLRKVDDRARNELSVVTAFGPASQGLPGTRIPATQGVAGTVYRTGRSHLASGVRADPSIVRGLFTGGPNEPHSVVSAPIVIGSTICGVIELVDREGGEPFRERDLALLEIFAGYTSSTLQNALDAKRASELARRDDLTGLFNDRWLHHRLIELIGEADAAGTPCALIFLDLDHFKGVNDSYGHLAGSQVLREVGFLLRRTVTQPGAFLARYGGDEFVLVFPETDLPAGREIAEHVRTTIAESTFIDREHGPQLQPLYLKHAITASLGVAVYRPGASPDPAHVSEQALLRAADTAMYAAKAAGKNRVAVAAD